MFCPRRRSSSCNSWAERKSSSVSNSVEIAARWRVDRTLVPGISAPPSHRFVPRKRAVPPLHRRWRGSSAPLLLIASLCIVGGGGHRRPSSSSLRSASSVAGVIGAPPPHRFALHRRGRGSRAVLAGVGDGGA